MSVWLPVKHELAAANGSKQFLICVKTTTKKRVAELTGCSLHNLNDFCGLFINETYSFDPPETEVVYFKNDHFDTPHKGEWLKLDDWRL